MPQLRDSGNHPVCHSPNSSNSDGASGTPRDTETSGTSDSLNSERSDNAELLTFDRIFGIETEYGVSVTGTDRVCDAGQVAMAMFQPVVSRARSTNTYLENGSRLYLDVGSHPEYATAEARDPHDALIQDLAGEQLMQRLALHAQEQLRRTHGPKATIHVYKNNADSAGHSFGCHENYLVRRFVPLKAIENELLPFLITRQLFTGAGRLTPDGFRITQRADFLDEAVSSATTRARPMVNTRDEPHADPDSYRRLHVIIGDSNRSQFATLMKLATTHLVLCVIEQAYRCGVPSGLESCALADPNAANRALSRDLTCTTAQLELAHADSMSALEIQYRYLAVVTDFLTNHGDQVKESMPSAYQVCDRWKQTLDDIAAGRFDKLASCVDWVAKKRLIDAVQTRHRDVPFARLEQIDMDYHDVANGTVYESLVRRGAMTCEVDNSTAAHALQQPPENTRAVLRGQFVHAAEAAGVRYSCDWTHVAISTPTHREATLLDPFNSTPNKEFTELMNTLHT